MKSKILYIALGVVALVLIIWIGVMGNKNSNVSKEAPADTTGSLNTPKNTSGTSKKPSPGSSTDLSIIPTQAQMDGAIFRLTSFNGKQVTENKTYTITFEGGQVKAKFCNQLSGPYVYDQGSLKAPNLVGTKMYCGDPANLMEIESAFISALNFGAQISYINGSLLISGPNALLTFTGSLD